MLKSLFLIKLQAFSPATLLKKSLQHMYFHANIAKFLRTLTLRNIRRWLLLWTCLKVNRNNCFVKINKNIWYAAKDKNEWNLSPTIYTPINVLKFTVPMKRKHNLLWSSKNIYISQLLWIIEMCFIWNSEVRK